MLSGLWKGFFWIIEHKSKPVHRKVCLLFCPPRTVRSVNSSLVLRTYSEATFSSKVKKKKSNQTKRFNRSPTSVENLDEEVHSSHKNIQTDSEPHLSGSSLNSTRRRYYDNTRIPARQLQTLDTLRLHCKDNLTTLEKLGGDGTCILNGKRQYTIFIDF